MDTPRAVILGVDYMVEETILIRADGEKLDNINETHHYRVLIRLCQIFEQNIHAGNLRYACSYNELNL